MNNTRPVGSDKIDRITEIKSNISKQLAQVRRELLVISPFIGSVAMRLELTPVRDIRCRTACTDARTVYFDIDFFSKLTLDEVLFVLAHEVWHNVLLHFDRRQTREIDLFNIATDMEVNYMLQTDLLGKAKMPKDLLLPPKEMEGKSAETIYDWLLKSGNRANSKKSRQFDKHIYSNDNGSDSETEFQPVTDQWGEVGFDSDFNPGIPSGAAESMRSAIVSAAQRYIREHGSLPANIAGYVTKLTRPQVNWRERLCQFVSKHYGSSRNWCPPNRRYLHGDMYFQSRRSEDLKIGVFIDTSGSTAQDLPQFFGELKGLVESFSGYTVHCIHCDAAVDKYEVYDDMNPFNGTESKIEYSGGGGTSLTPPFKYIADHNIDIDCAIYMTDGYASKPDIDPPRYPVLWLLPKDGTDKAIRDFGEIVYFKDSQF